MSGDQAVGAALDPNLLIPATNVSGPRVLARVESTTLLTALADVGAPMTTRAQVPMQHGVKLSVRPDGLRLQRTDGETWTAALIPAEFERLGDVVADARALAGQVRGVGRGHDITLTLVPRGGKEWLRVAGDGVTYQLTSMPLVEWPIEPDDPGEFIATLAAADVGLLARTVSAARVDDTLPILTAVRLLEVQGSLRACATDRYRMTEVNTLHPVPAGFGALVPANSLRHVARLAAREGDVTITRHSPASRSAGLFNSDDLVFTVGTRRLRVTCQGGEYPKVDALWPPEAQGTVEVDWADLTRAIRRLQIVTPQGWSCRVEVAGERLILSSADGEAFGADATTDIACSVTGSPAVMHLNPHLFIDVVNAIDGDRVVLKTTQSTRPLVLEGVGGRLSRAMLMPVRHRER